MFRHRFVTSSAVLAVLASAVAMAPAPVTAAVGGTRNITATGVTSFRPGVVGTAELAKPEIRGGSSANGVAGTGAGAPTVSKVNRSQSEEAGNSAGSGDSADNQSVHARLLNILNSFNGLRHRDQRLANGGNQFSVEPPDQGLCVGNGFVVEPVNTVIKIFDGSGNVLKGTEDLNTFLGYAAQFDRTTGLVGPFVTDPSCTFDKDSQRWFLTVLTLEVFPDTGNFTGVNHLDLAVSNSAKPTGLWTIYRTDVTDDGTNGTPNHHCAPFPQAQPPTNPNACIGDYPHLGADANGFYITTNEYPLFPPTGFIGAQVYAFNKHALAANAATVGVTQINTADTDRTGFTMWPALAPDSQFATANRGTEYFMSSDAADEVNPDRPPSAPKVSNHLIVWTLGNTRSLNGDEPELNLESQVLRVGKYAVPGGSAQKAGPTPLADCVNDTSLDLGGGFFGCWQLFFNTEPKHDETEYQLDSNDTRMQQVMFAHGQLWGALDTAIKVSGAIQSGIEWFVVNPGSEGDGARVANRGYLAVPGNNVIYPAIGVTASGQGVMAFTLVGKDHYPSAAFTSINAGGLGPVQVAAEGVGPADGFSGYDSFAVPQDSPARPRWGDYGAAVPDGNTMWIASEYIGQSCTFAQYADFSGANGPPLSCNSTRTAFGNWFTRITHVQLGGENGGSD